MSDEQLPPPDRSGSLADWSVSAINAMVGDRLRERRNGLEVEMAFHAGGRPLHPTRGDLLRSHPDPTGKLVVLVHGLACHEGIWAFRDPAHGPRATSYGARLRSDLGYTPFYLRYNTGLPIAENGARLSTLLQALVDRYPRPVEELVLIGHSMGGLLIRDAGVAGGRDGAAWLRLVRRVVYLGTPHEGAPLARLGELASAVLRGVPDPVARLVGRVLELRSAGVRELRGGARTPAEGPAVPGATPPPPWSPGTRHHLAVGTLAGDPGHPLSVLLGDGLVLPPRRGAREGPGDGSDPAGYIRFFPRTHHLRLPRDPAVYAQIREWCATP